MQALTGGRGEGAKSEGLGERPQPLVDLRSGQKGSCPLCLRRR